MTEHSDQPVKTGSKGADYAISSLRMSGFQFTDEEIEDLVRLDRGEITMDEILEKYSRHLEGEKE